MEVRNEKVYSGWMLCQVLSPQMTLEVTEFTAPTNAKGVPHPYPLLNIIDHPGAVRLDQTEHRLVPVTHGLLALHGVFLEERSIGGRLLTIRRNVQAFNSNIHATVACHSED